MVKATLFAGVALMAGYVGNQIQLGRQTSVYMYSFGATACRGMTSEKIRNEANMSSLFQHDPEWFADFERGATTTTKFEPLEVRMLISSPNGEIVIDRYGNFTKNGNFFRLTDDAFCAFLTDLWMRIPTPMRPGNKEDLLRN